MKKAVSIISAVVIFFLCSCARQELQNIHAFISSLKQNSDISDIEDDSLFASEEDEEIRYAFRVNDDYLLGIYADKSTQKLKSCCVTFVYSSDKFTEKDNTEFFNICKGVVRSYENISADSAENLLKEMKIHQIDKIDSFHRKKDFYYYSFFKNKLGFSFTVESTRLNEEDSTDKKLTEKITLEQ